MCAAGVFHEEGTIQPYSDVDPIKYWTLDLVRVFHVLGCFFCFVLFFISWQVDLMRVDLVPIDLMTLSHV